MFGAIIDGWDWWAVAAFALGALLWVMWEVRGIVLHDEHDVDTLSEIYWQARKRTGKFRGVLAVALAAFLVWLWYHFTFQGEPRSRGTDEAEHSVPDDDDPLSTADKYLE